MLAGGGGQHGWASLIRWIFANGWLPRLRLGACPATRRRRDSAWASARQLSGCGACVRPAALRQGRWAGTSRRQFRANTGPGCLSAPRQGFTLRGLVAELAERGLKVDYRAVWNFVHAEKLSFKKNRGGQRTRS